MHAVSHETPTPEEPSLENVPPQIDWRKVGALGVAGAVSLGIVYAADRGDIIQRPIDAVTPLGTEAADERLLGAGDNQLDIAWLPDTVKRWEPEIEAASERYDIDPDLISVVMTVESGGWATAESEVGAMSLMQVMPTTAEDIATRLLKEPVASDAYDPWDPVTNIEFGTAYIADLRDQAETLDQEFTDELAAEFVAAGYNGGPGRALDLAAGKGVDNDQTLQHSRDVMNMYRERHSEASPTLQRWLERGGQGLVDQASAEQ